MFCSAPSAHPASPGTRREWKAEDEPPRACRTCLQPPSLPRLIGTEEDLGWYGFLRVPQPDLPLGWLSCLMVFGLSLSLRSAPQSSRCCVLHIWDCFSLCSPALCTSGCKGIRPSLLRLGQASEPLAQLSHVHACTRPCLQKSHLPKLAQVQFTVKPDRKPGYAQD